MPNRIVDMGSWIRYTFLQTFVWCRLYHQPIKDGCRAYYLGRNLFEVAFKETEVARDGTLVRGIRPHNRRETIAVQSLQDPNAFRRGFPRYCPSSLAQNISSGRSAPYKRFFLLKRPKISGFTVISPDFLSYEIAFIGAYYWLSLLSPG